MLFRKQAEALSKLTDVFSKSLKAKQQKVIVKNNVMPKNKHYKSDIKNKSGCTE